MNILIVDDSAMMRGIIRQVIVDNRGEDACTVYDASNGEEALRTFETKSVDIVFIDWNMPVVDGLEVVKRLRARNVGIPIIMVSAFTDEEKVYQAAKAGVTSYIEKPIRGGELWARIKEYVP